jgi:hypothetical protein
MSSMPASLSFRRVARHVGSVGSLKRREDLLEFSSLRRCCGNSLAEPVPSVGPEPDESAADYKCGGGHYTETLFGKSHVDLLRGSGVIAE